MLTKLRTLRAHAQTLFTSHIMQFFIAGLLIFSAITISWEITIRYQETPEAQSMSVLLGHINTFVLYGFAIEILARILVFGRSYFKSGWNIFDLVVVGLSLLATGSFFQIIRTFRLFLFLRTFAIFPNFQHLLAALGQSLPRIFSTLMLLLIAIYIFAVWGVIEYAPSFPAQFGDLSAAFGTIFHGVLLGHTWSEVYDTMVKVDPDVGFFIYPMVVVLNFLLLQLVLGVIINALHFQHINEDEHKKHSFILGWLVGKNKNHHDSPLTADTKIILHEIHKLKSDLVNLQSKIMTLEEKSSKPKK